MVGMILHRTKTLALLVLVCATLLAQQPPYLNPDLPAERRATGLPGVEPHWELIEAAFSSRAELAIVQAQDVLGLGTEARMNMPGTSQGNWGWRLRPGRRRPGTPAFARVLRRLVSRFRRGRITITDRRGLESASCACYGVLREVFDRLV